LGGHEELTKEIEIPESGRLAVRVEADGKPHHGVMNSTVYAHSGAIYLKRGSTPTRSAEDARSFIKWIDRSVELIEAEKDWNSPADKQHTNTPLIPLNARAKCMSRC